LHHWEKISNPQILQTQVPVEALEDDLHIDMEAAIGSSYIDDDGAEELLSRAAARLKDVASSRDASILLSTAKGSRGMANRYALHFIRRRASTYLLIALAALLMI
jgi:hypothetical protein